MWEHVSVRPSSFVLIFAFLCFLWLSFHIIHIYAFFLLSSPHISVSFTLAFFFSPSMYSSFTVPFHPLCRSTAFSPLRSLPFFWLTTFQWQWPRLFGSRHRAHLFFLSLQLKKTLCYSNGLQKRESFELVLKEGQQSPSFSLSSLLLGFCGHWQRGPSVFAMGPDVPRQQTGC